MSLSQNLFRTLNTRGTGSMDYRRALRDAEEEADMQRTVMDSQARYSDNLIRGDVNRQKATTRAINTETRGRSIANDEAERRNENNAYWDNYVRGDVPTPNSGSGFMLSDNDNQLPGATNLYMDSEGKLSRDRQSQLPDDFDMERPSGPIMKGESSKVLKWYDKDNPGGDISDDFIQRINDSGYDLTTPGGRRSAMELMTNFSDAENMAREMDKSQQAGKKAGAMGQAVTGIMQQAAMLSSGNPAMGAIGNMIGLKTNKTMQEMGQAMQQSEGEIQKSLKSMPNEKINQLAKQWKDKKKQEADQAQMKRLQNLGASIKTGSAMLNPAAEQHKRQQMEQQQQQLQQQKFRDQTARQQQERLASAQMKRIKPFGGMLNDKDYSGATNYANSYLGDPPVLPDMASPEQQQAHSQAMLKYRQEWKGAYEEHLNRRKSDLYEQYGGVVPKVGADGKPVAEGERNVQEKPQQKIPTRGDLEQMISQSLTHIKPGATAPTAEGILQSLQSTYSPEELKQSGIDGSFISSIFQRVEDAKNKAIELEKNPLSDDRHAESKVALKEDAKNGLLNLAKLHPPYFAASKINDFAKYITEEPGAMDLKTFQEMVNSSEQIGNETTDRRIRRSLKAIAGLSYELDDFTKDRKGFEGLGQKALNTVWGAVNKAGMDTPLRASLLRIQEEKDKLRKVMKDSPDRDNPWVKQYIEMLDKQLLSISKDRNFIE